MISTVAYIYSRSLKARDTPKNEFTSEGLREAAVFLKEPARVLDFRNFKERHTLGIEGHTSSKENQGIQ